MLSTSGHSERLSISRERATTARTQLAQIHVAGRSDSRPEVMRVTSSMLLMSADSRSIWRTAISSLPASFSGRVVGWRPLRTSGRTLVSLSSSAVIGVLQLVRGDRQELVARPHRLAQLLLGPLAVGDVLHHRDRVARPAVGRR